MKKILNRRLERISAFISCDDNVMDIGCDHALLDIYLALYKKNKKIIGSDIHEKPLLKAKENLLKYHVSDKIELRLGNGLKTLDEEIDTIVISGMGGENIINILKDINNYQHIKKIILSPNSDFTYVRKMMKKYQFKILEEEIVFEKSKYYLISVYIKGRERNNHYFGKLDLNNEIVKHYYEMLYKKNREILSHLSLIKKMRRISLIKENCLIKRHIHF